MKDAERIYALYVQANPVPGADLLPLTQDEAVLLTIEGSQHMITQERVETPAASAPPRRRGLVAAGAIAAVVAVGLVAALLVSGNESQPVAAASPEEVVAQVVEASNAQDAEALAALYDPEIRHIYDASGVGASQANTDYSGRENVMGVVGVVWDNYSPNVVSYEVRQVDGNTVTTLENVMLSTGQASQHAVTYEVSDDGLILRQEHIVLR